MRKFLLTFVLLSFGTVVVSHGADANPSPDASKPKGERVVKVGLGFATAVAESKGWFKEEFGKLGARVELVKSSPLITQSLFERGDIDITTYYEYTTIVQISNSNGGFNPVIIDQTQNLNPRAMTIIVLKDSPIHTLADLKGKTLAVTRYSDHYFGCFETLLNHGLKLDSNLGKGDVHYLNVSGEGANSLPTLLSGKVDAVTLRAAGAPALEVQGELREIGTATPGGYFVHGDRYASLAPRKWVDANPDLVRAYHTVYNKTRVWIVEHPEEAAAISAEVLRTPRDLTEARIKDPANPIYLPLELHQEGAIEAIESLQKWAAANGDDLLSKKVLTHEELLTIVDKRFYKGGEYYAGDPLEPHVVKPAGVADASQQSPSVTTTEK